MTAIAEPNTEPLWARVRASFARAMAALGAPAAIAALGFLDKALKREIVRWLYPLEAMVRRLLLAEAAALRRAELARRERGPRIVHVPLRSLSLANHTWTAGLQTASGVAKRCASEDARSKTDPQSWRASFALAIPRNPHIVSDHHAPRIINLWAPDPIAREPVHTPSANREPAAFRFARRFEALRRVLENPAPYAAKLARLLVREARRYCEVARRYVLRGSRVDAYDRADDRLSLDVLAAAFDAPEGFRDSS